MTGRTAVAIAALVALLALPFQSAAQAQEEASFLIEPGPASSMSPDGGYFIIRTKPGKLVKQSVVLRNDSQRTLPLQLGAVDTLTGPLGGTSYGLPADPVALTGAWISMGKSELSLAPGSSERVPFEIRVPENATSGQHLAGIAAYVPNEADEQGGAAPGEAGAIVTVQTRRVVTVLIELPGPKGPELVISGVDVEARTDSVYLGIAIANEGFGLTVGDGVIELPEHGFRRSFDVGNFVPGTAISYPIEWEATPAEGEYPVTVEISYDGGVARYEGTFIVGEAVSQELAGRRGSSGPNLLLIVSGMGALVLGGAAALWWRKRRWRSVSQRPRLIPRPAAVRPLAERPAQLHSLRPPPPPPPPASSRTPPG